jgi:hypothetical protein
MKPIEIRLVGADEMGDLVDPRGMIDQLLPPRRFAEGSVPRDYR